MRKELIIILYVIIVISCNANSPSTRIEQTDEDSEGSGGGDCKYEDGIHSATVQYYNPNTGHSNTYTLNVEVDDCSVIQINFPNGGWLDETHISPEELDEDGSASIVDDRGRSFNIHIDE